MALLRVGPLPEAALAAAAEFHARVLPDILAQLNPPRDGEVASRSDDGGGSPPEATSRQAANPHHHSADGPAVASQRLRLPRPGEDLVLVFPPADYTHRAWRVAVVRDLAREHASIRINGVASDDETAIAAALHYLANAPGVTGQYWPLDGQGAGSA